ncbi:MAG: hypothetical protein AMJ95_05350 [Omnitrophica WOR_2 bacterium SM23_72]|nr:MAG: hypothetical protein AMJ95_05350 [Omnitrophica WOR_2 bacterium SM23_72]
MDFERRKFPRLNSGMVTKFLKFGPGESMGEKRSIVFTQDLSCSGARVAVRGDIKRGEYCTLILQMPFTLFPILINGEVKWVKGSDSDNGISDIKEVGINFVEMDETGKSKIERFIAKKIKIPLQPMHEVINTV